MEELKKINETLVAIQERNKRVETEKAWETSKTRIISILILTYATSVVLFYILESKNPWLNALLPTMGFYLSTQSVSFLKKKWMGKIKKG